MSEDSIKKKIIKSYIDEPNDFMMLKKKLILSCDQALLSFNGCTITRFILLSHKWIFYPSKKNKNISVVSNALVLTVMESFLRADEPNLIFFFLLYNFSFGILYSVLLKLPSSVLLFKIDISSSS